MGLATTDSFQPGAFVRTTYRPGHDSLFLITDRIDDMMWLENCLTGHDLPVPVRELHNPDSWAPVIPEEDK